MIKLLLLLVEVCLDIVDDLELELCGLRREGGVGEKTDILEIFREILDIVKFA